MPIEFQLCNTFSISGRPNVSFSPLMGMVVPRNYLCNNRHFIRIGHTYTSENQCTFNLKYFAAPFCTH